MFLKRIEPEIESITGEERDTASFMKMMRLFNEVKYSVFCKDFNDKKLVCLKPCQKIGVLFFLCEFSLCLHMGGQPVNQMFVVLLDLLVSHILCG